MAKVISNLSTGSQIKDNNGNSFVVIAKDHYGSNQVTLMQITPTQKMSMGASNKGIDYSTSNIAEYMLNSYLSTLQTELADSIITTNLPYTKYNGANKVIAYMNVKAFILSITELGLKSFSTAEKAISYDCKKHMSQHTWLRGRILAFSNHYFEAYHPEVGYINSDASMNLNFYPIFNVPYSLTVTDNPNNGAYSFVFDVPPVVETISNVSANFGEPANIIYNASDDISANLSHYISFDNGVSWEQILPIKNGNSYSYSYQIGEVGTYNCRIKVVDESNQQATSNLFAITINASAPTVNIVSVEDKTINFKANCLTHEITKVEILINENLVETYSSGFNSILSYGVDRTILNIGKNTMRIKATSSENLEGYKDIEINKELYNLPPEGTKVIVGDEVYSIIHAEQSGSNQSYILDRQLLSSITKGQEIKVTQDRIKVLCSLTNLENSTDFKEMKLVKTKKLKGSLEGYIEEKYELEGEGRYSAIKLETERFNNTVESEIIELQQYFDYVQD